MDHSTDILILGAGIGGYETFRTLARLLRKYKLPQTITLVDQNNYFSFTPMHHEVATGSIEPSHCTIPLHEVVAGTPHTFLEATVIGIDPAAKKVQTSAGAISYRYCVVALGSVTNYFGVQGAPEFSHHVRSLPAARALRRDIIRNLEEKKHIRIVVVGGGTTGAEMAGQLADFAKTDIKKLYPNRTIEISILESESELLMRLPKRARVLAEKRLTRDGVSMCFNCRVQKITADSVHMEDETIPSDITIWTAGFQNIAPQFLDENLCDKGRLRVTQCLNVAEMPSLYAVGDIASACNPGCDEAHPQLGEAAHKHGQYVARHIAATLRKKHIKKFVFRSMGTLLPIGDWYGIASIGPFIFGGRFAWWLRRTVYLLFMPGLSRKLRIVTDWTFHSFGVRYMVDIEGK